MTYLSQIQYRLGQRVALEELGDPEVTRNLALLRGQGLVHARTATVPALELASTSAIETLVHNGTSTPDALVFATDRAAGASLSEDLWTLNQAVNAPDTPAVAVGGHACGNLAPALWTARNTLFGDEVNEVLVITTSIAGTGTRYQEFGTTVASDGAASCLVTSSPHGPAFRLLATATQTRAALSPEVLALAGARTIATAVRACQRDLRAKLGEQWIPEHVITGNYGATTRSFLAKTVGAEQVSAPVAELTADLGHCSAADLLITLKHWERAETRRDGETLLLLATSPRSWSLIALEYLLDPRPCD